MPLEAVTTSGSTPAPGCGTKARPMPKLRLSICRNAGKNRGIVSGVVLVEPRWKEVAAAARGKLKLSAKELKALRLFLRKDNGRAVAGTELDSASIGECLTNDSVLSVSVGEPFFHSDGRAQTDGASRDWPLAPCFPWPAGPHSPPAASRKLLPEAPPEAGDTAGPAWCPGNASEDRLAPLCEFEMDGPFVCLEGDVSKCLREAIGGCTGFTVKDCGWWHAFDYKSAHGGMEAMFPNPLAARKGTRERWNLAARRECRGLLVCSRTGRVLRRPLHKFFNLEEISETTDLSGLTLPRHSRCLSEKLDGSLVSALQLDRQWVWAGKSAVNADVAGFVGTQQAGYIALVQACEAANQTALFEWCPEEQVAGVIRHAEPSLQLIAVRDIFSGQYATPEQLEQLAAEHSVPLTRQFAPEDLGLKPGCTIAELCSVVRAWTDTEGIVLSLNGALYKIKTSWYMQMVVAATRGGKQGGARFLGELVSQSGALSAAPAAAVWGCVLSEQSDDEMSLCCALLSEAGQPEQAQLLKRFRDKTLAGFKDLHAELLQWGASVNSALQIGESHSLMEAVAASSVAGWQTTLLVAYCQARAAGSDLHAQSELSAQLRKLCVEQKILALEKLLKCRWSTDIVLIDGAELERTSIGAEVFAQARENCGVKLLERIREHTCGVYLNKKIANMQGKQVGEINGDTEVYIHPDHAPDEGKLKGCWELFQSDGIADLRLDLQPQKQSGHDDHYGDSSFANIQVQFGPSSVCKKSSKKTSKAHLSGGLAGILVATGACHRLDHLRAALELSFDCAAYVRVHAPSGTAQIGPGQDPCNLQIFCDLDGVLVDFQNGLNSAGEAVKVSVLNCSEAQKWSVIQKTPHFFADLDWCEGAQSLWQLISEELPTNAPPKILTATPGGKLGKRVDKDKRLWCKKHLPKVEVITCLSEDKVKSSGKNCVLIDDSLKHKEPWEESGGIFIHHSDLDRTIWLLRKLFLDSELCTTLAAAVETFEQPSATPEPYTIDKGHIVLVDGSDNADRFTEAVAARPHAVGIDVEWCPDELNKGSKRSSAAVVQVAVHPSSTVFCLDWIRATEQTRYAVIDLLCDSAVLKVGFGFAADLERLALQPPCGAQPVLDLQQVATSIFRQEQPALSHFVQQILPGQNLVKAVGKLSHQDWEKRPLSLEMIQYAACDAMVLLDLHKELCAEPSGAMKTALWALQHTVSRPKGSRGVLQHRSRGDTAHPEAVPRAASIYLDADSRSALLSACPARHKQHHVDHVTLLYQPERHQLSDLRVGSKLKIEVLSEHWDRTCQSVRVRLHEDPGIGIPDEQILHVTISTLQGVGAVDSLRLLADSCCDSREISSLVLTGTVGLRVVLEIKSDPLGCLEAKVKAQVLDFVESAQVGEMIKLKHLSSTERHALHEFAELHSMQSRSEGMGDARKLILTKKHTGDACDSGLEGGRVVANATDLEQETGKKSKTKSQTLTITDRASFRHWLVGPQAPGSSTESDSHGICHTDHVEWLRPHDSPLFGLLEYGELDLPLVVILRGIPGSGKSHLCSHLLEKCSSKEATKCSADEFFERGAGRLSSRAMKGRTKSDVYAEAFNIDLLPEAHQYCRDQFDEALHGGQVQMIVVDNTNTRLKDYVYYLEQATSAGWYVQVVELLVSDQQVAALAARQCHGVPAKACAMMQQRLKQEPHDGALRLRPYVAVSQIPTIGQTDRWLMKNGLIHYNKGQPATHLRMAVNDSPVAFVNVPASLESEFLEVYAADAGPKYLCEYATREFRMYLDFDYEGRPLTECQTLQCCRVLQTVVQELYPDSNPTVLVTGCPVQDSAEGDTQVKTGLHLKLPYLLVEQDSALRIRETFVRRLHDMACSDPGSWGDRVEPWDQVVDEAVFQHRTLRMLFSRKASNKYVDLGREYQLLAVVGRDGILDEDLKQQYLNDPQRLLADASIRS